MCCTIESATDGDYLHVAALDRISWPTAPDLFIPDGEHIWRIWCYWSLVDPKAPNHWRNPLTLPVHW